MAKKQIGKVIRVSEDTAILARVIVERQLAQYRPLEHDRQHGEEFAARVRELQTAYDELTVALLGPSYLAGEKAAAAAVQP